MKRMLIMLSVLLIGLCACSSSPKVANPRNVKSLPTITMEQSRGVKPLAASPEEPPKPLAAATAEPPNQCPAITDISISDLPVNAEEQTRIAATASDPERNQLFYFWRASGGTLTGREAQVVWTAPKCSDNGQTEEAYTITVEVSDGKCKVNRDIPVAVNCGNRPEAVILFPQGGAKLDNIAKAQLDAFADLLKQSPDQALRLAGHSDNRGQETANQQIGLKRAESVKQYLVKRHGIDPQRLTTTSAGSTKPADTNDTDAGRAKNRRVEIYGKL